MLQERQIQSILGFFISWNRIHSRDTYTVNSNIIHEVVESTEASTQSHNEATVDICSGKHTANSNMVNILLTVILPKATQYD